MDKSRRETLSWLDDACEDPKNSSSPTTGAAASAATGPVTSNLASGGSTMSESSSGTEAAAKEWNEECYGLGTLQSAALARSRGLVKSY